MTKKHNAETIELSLPVNAAYVSAARLTASSVANRLGFDIDEIEDIKAAVSEACIYIIKKAAGSKSNLFKLNFHLESGFLTIFLAADICGEPAEPEAEMSLMMIKALMDTLNLITENPSALEIRMTKKHQDTIL